MVLEYLPYFSLLEEQNAANETTFGCMCEFYGEKFLIKIIMKSNQFLYVQGVKTEEGASHKNAMEFYICIITHLFMKEIDLNIWATINQQYYS